MVRIDTARECMTSNQTARARRKSAPGSGAAPVTSGPSVATEPRPVLTTIPVEHDADWVRLPKPGQTLCGMTRSYLYQLCAQGKIRSVTIRQPQNKRGVRLIYRPSIHAFLAKLDLAQNGAQEAAQ
jgi:hypothetical protein